jgi:hypothetical protein
MDLKLWGARAGHKRESVAAVVVSHNSQVRCKNGEEGRPEIHRDNAATFRRNQPAMIRLKKIFRIKVEEHYSSDVNCEHVVIRNRDSLWWTDGADYL